MTYGEAKQLLSIHVKDKFLLYHCFETACIMSVLAKHFGEDEERWAVAGLLHDIDFEKVKEIGDIKKHCVLCVDILRDAGVDDEMIETIVSHAWGTDCDGAKDKVRSTKFQHALAAAETITGLIVACSLVMPDKKLASVKPESVLKKFKQPAFAAKVPREIIDECEKIGFTREQFVEISLRAMQENAAEFGL
ncbi:HDIG domain-containing protein [Candidatus Peregrinibacteria bacterium]|nr:HDIG domain-containing protein [Candidatus Peregrinibacteria bacterium]